MNADGSHFIRLDDSQVIRLTDNKIDDCCPVWSPDGSKIVFVRGSESTSEIWVMAADGSSPTRLTSNDYPDGHAAWSPDGTKIVFLARQPNLDEIKVMNADGSNPITLAASGSDEGYFYYPRWSPDGAKIAFMWEGFEGFDCQGCSEIFVMNADGSDLIQVTDNDGISQDPVWSPDGTKIAYETYAFSSDFGIFLMNPDGSGQTHLIDILGWYSYPSWSPDGARIAFSSGQEHARIIYVMNADGSSPIMLNQDADGNHPAWSPDGARIAFIEGVKGYIYTMNADGSGLIDVISVAHTFSFSWRPIVATPSSPACDLSWTRLAAGVSAQVSKTSNVNDQLLVVISQLLPGTIVEVVEGPVCSDGVIYWKVESDLIPGGAGWMAEGDGMEYYLAPYQP